MGREENEARRFERYMQKQTTRLDVKEILDGYDRELVEPTRRLVANLAEALQEWWKLPWYRRVWLSLRGKGPL